QRSTIAFDSPLSKQRFGNLGEKDIRLKTIPTPYNRCDPRLRESRSILSGFGLISDVAIPPHCVVSVLDGTVRSMDSFIGFFHRSTLSSSLENHLIIRVSSNLVFDVKSPFSRLNNKCREFNCEVRFQRINQQICFYLYSTRLIGCNEELVISYCDCFVIPLRNFICNCASSTHRDFARWSINTDRDRNEFNKYLPIQQKFDRWVQQYGRYAPEWDIATSILVFNDLELSEVADYFHEWCGNEQFISNATKEAVRALCDGKQ
ncbi:hypothetical protein B4U80_14366, partial [Leptotrombidium deliense]